MASCSERWRVFTFTSASPRGTMFAGKRSSQKFSTICMSVLTSCMWSYSKYSSCSCDVCQVMFLSFQPKSTTCATLESSQRFCCAVRPLYGLTRVRRPIFCLLFCINSTSIFRSNAQAPGNRPCLEITKLRGTGWKLLSTSP